MKRFILVLLILLFAVPSFAEYVIKVKFTDTYIPDFQGNTTAETLIKNAEKEGYEKANLQVVEVTPEEYKAIVSKYFKDNPVEEDTTVKDLITSIRAKLITLGFTADEADFLLGTIDL